MNRTGRTAAVGYLIFIPPHLSNPQSHFCRLQSSNPGQGNLVLASHAHPRVPSIMGKDGVSGSEYSGQPLKAESCSRLEVKHAGRSWGAKAPAPGLGDWVFAL